MKGKEIKIKGRIVKGVGGFYYVNDAQGNQHECKACGRFRKERVKPLIGDHTEFTPQGGGGYGLITDIFPRKNFLVRPAVANIDMVLIVLSAGKPHADLMLCDKLIIQAERSGIEPVVCINKMETDETYAQTLRTQYGGAYHALCVSAYEGTGLERMKRMLRGKCVCFAGQSAVGKTSLINHLFGDGTLETGGLSRKTERGKHTTRTAELFYLRELNAYVLDTPGFSMFCMEDLQKEEYAGYYRDFAGFSDTCKFSTCLHDREPNCGVKQAVEEGKINRERYDRYKKLIHLGEKSYD